MDAMNLVLAAMSPEDTAAALRLLEILERCGQMTAIEAGEWAWRVVAWARFTRWVRGRSRTPKTHGRHVLDQGMGRQQHRVWTYDAPHQATWKGAVAWKVHP
jgi:hypothetical protein